MIISFHKIKRIKKNREVNLLALVIFDFHIFIFSALFKILKQFRFIVPVVHPYTAS